MRVTRKTSPLATVTEVTRSHGDFRIPRWPFRRRRSATFLFFDLAICENEATRF